MYTPAEDKSDQDSQNAEDYEALLSESSENHRPTTRKRFLWLAVVLIPVISLGLIGIGVWIGSRLFSNPDDLCPRHVQHYCKNTLTQSEGFDRS